MWDLRLCGLGLPFKARARHCPSTSSHQGRDRGPLWLWGAACSTPAILNHMGSQARKGFVCGPGRPDRVSQQIPWHQIPVGSRQALCKASDQSWWKFAGQPFLVHHVCSPWHAPDPARGIWAWNSRGHVTRDAQNGLSPHVKVRWPHCSPQWFIGIGSMQAQRGQ